MAGNLIFVRNRTEALSVASELFKKLLRKYGRSIGETWGVEAFESVCYDHKNCRYIKLWYGPLDLEGNVERFRDYEVHFKYRRRAGKKGDQSDKGGLVEEVGGEDSGSVGDSVGGNDVVVERFFPSIVDRGFYVFEKILDVSAVLLFSPFLLLATAPFFILGLLHSAVMFIIDRLVR